MLEKYFAIRTGYEYDSRTMQDAFRVGLASLDRTDDRIVHSNVI